MFSKTNLVRLKGKALQDLQNAIYERDGGRCVVCHCYVQEGEKFHHEPCGSGRKSDEITKGVILCYSCHQKRHSTEHANEIKEKVEEYLNDLYGGKL